MYEVEVESACGLCVRFEVGMSYESSMRSSESVRLWSAVAAIERSRLCVCVQRKPVDCIVKFELPTWANTLGLLLDFSIDDRLWTLDEKRKFFVMK